MNIKYFLETFKLVLVIFNVSYFTGIIWIIFCDFMEKYILKHDDSDPVHSEENGDAEIEDDANFIDCY